jgi:hypothetical protein
MKWAVCTVCKKTEKITKLVKWAVCTVCKKTEKITKLVAVQKPRRQPENFLDKTGEVFVLECPHHQEIHVS